MTTDRKLRAERLVNVGRALIGCCLTLLVVGKATVTIFFPGLVGNGIPESVLPALVATWVIGLFGVLTCLIAWIQAPTLYPRIELPRFSLLTRVLAAVIAAVFALGMVLLAADVTQPDSFFKRAMGAYCVVTLCGFVIYLSFIYREERAPATGTYLNLLTPLFGFALIPFAWPAVVWFNWRSHAKPEEMIRDVSKP